MPREYKQQDSVQHKCANCGAALKYDPESGKLLCEHCGGFVEFEKNNSVHERDFNELMTYKHFDESDITCYRCANCGAITVASRTTLATTCPYCASPVIIQDVSGSIIKPDTVVPFELSANQAAEQLNHWRKRKLFAPHNFRKHASADSVKGVYIPCWTFDAQTSTNYHGSVGYHRTRTVRRNGKTYTETYTEWRNIKGVWNTAFDDIFVRGNENISEGNFRKLQPFPQSKYMSFNNEYLAGYIADHYTVEPTTAFEKAKVQMEQSIRQQILNHYHADVEGTLNINLQILSKSFKYVMLPVYVASTRFGKKLYNQYISGIVNEKKQSKICGNYPVSGWKVFVTVLLGLGALVGLAFLVWRAMQNGDIDISFALQNFTSMLPK